jgi:hypothetical protein
MQPSRRIIAQTELVANEQHALMRGLVHGVILSLVVWTVAIYLTLAFR